MANFNELYDRLNDKQREAVDHVDGPMMVLAGAGTGKTQVLAMRIANLMRMTGIGLGNILCLTFTEAGVAAMRERLIRILGSEGYGAKVATFHSFSNEVMSDYPEKFLQTTELLPLTDLERVRYLSEILQVLPYGNPLKHQNNPLLYLPDVSSRISELKREGVSPEQLEHFIDQQERFAEATKDVFESMFDLNAGQYSEVFLDGIRDELIKLGKSAEGSNYLYRSAGLLLERARQLAALNPTKTGKISYSKLKEEIKRFAHQVGGKLDQQRALVSVYSDYLASLHSHGRYDFEDMINNVLGLMVADENVRRDFQERYQYVLVDEYQDTNTAQNRLVDVFGFEVESPNVFVVGDDDQSIFRFQGASLENVVGFARQYSSSVKVVSLTHNYRSQPTILKVADSLISHNQFRAAVAIPDVQKLLLPGLQLGEKPIQILSFDSSTSELYWIARTIREYLDHGVEGHEIAVLAKTNGELIEILPYMKQFAVPFALSKSENAFENAVVNQFLRLLKAIKNPYDNENFFFLLESATAGISPIEFLRINKYVLSKPRSSIVYFDMIGDIEKLHEAGVVDTISCSALYQNILRWREMMGRLSPMELISEIVASCGILDLCSDVGENELDNLRALGALVNEFGRAIQSDRSITFDMLVDTIFEMLQHNLALPLGERGAQLGRVSLTTVHKSKGLEYRYVFVINAIEKKWEKGGRVDKLGLPLNLFENDLGVAARQQEEEARRLFYVAITRAREELFISYSQSDADGKQRIASRFLQELGDEFVQKQEVVLDQSAERAKLTMRLVGLRRPESYDEDTQIFLRERLQDYALSASHLNAYRKCPRMFYYQYFIRAPIVPDAALVIGSAAHKAVEALFESNVHGEVLRVDQLIELYSRQLDRSWLVGAAYEDALERGRQFLPKYYEYRIHSLPKRIKIETDFSYHGICLDSIRLTGKLDMIEFTDEVAKRCVVYDFKTGDPLKGVKRVAYDEDTWRQVVFYKLLTVKSRRFGYVMERGVVEFIEPNSKTGEFENVEVIVTEEDVALVTEQIKEMWEQLQNLQFRCKEPIGECNYCRNILKIGEGERF